MTAPGLTPPDEWAELRALAEVATPGPWTVEAFPHRVDIDAADGGWIFRSGKDEATIFERDMDPDEVAQTVADANFIAAARTAVPALLDEVDRLRRQSLSGPVSAAYAKGYRDALTAAVKRIEFLVDGTVPVLTIKGINDAARIVADLRDGAR